MHADRYQQISRYLLGELTEEEREDFERDFFEADELAAEVLATEERLMEDYVSGILEPGRRRQFENVYLSHAAHRDELRLHEALRTISSASRASERDIPASRKWAVAALAACMAFLAFGLLLLFRQNRQLQADIRNVQASQRQLEVHAPPAAVPPAPQVSISGAAEQAGASVPAILLLPGIRNAGSGAPLLRLPPGATAYLLLADVNSSTESYQALIESVEGSVLFQAGPLRGNPDSNGRVRLQLAVSSGQLDPGDYILVLRNGSRTAGEYYFRLVK